MQWLGGVPSTNTLCALSDLHVLLLLLLLLLLLSRPKTIKRNRCS
jgi:hypothetical protein